MPRIDHPLLKGLLFGSVALLAMGVLAQSSLAQAAEKAKVCHRPPDTPLNIRIIEVRPSAVADHIAHGDNLVDSEVCSDMVDNDCDGLVDEADSDCETPPAGCPCEGGMVETTSWNSEFQTAVCVEASNGIVLLAEGGRLESLGFGSPISTWLCTIVDEATGTFSSETITENEFEACLTSLEAIAAGDGVTCGPPG